MVPLPDADPDKRMYRLLKNIDLENLTFEQFQSTAQTVFAEPESEDTLRRIVLINLSRMAVAGQWNGLTTSAGASGGFVEILPLTGTTDADQYDVASPPPWNGKTITSQSVSGFKKPMCFPFIAPETGDLSAIGIQVISAEAGDSLYVAIYSQDTNFLPSTLLGYATISLASTGEIYQTSLSATVTLTAGSQYWYSISTNTSSSATIRSLHNNDTPSLGITDALLAFHHCIEDTTRDDYAVPPSTFTPAALDTNEPRVVVGLKY